MVYRYLYSLIPFRSRQFVKNSKIGLYIIALTRLPLILIPPASYSQFNEDIIAKKYTPEKYGFYLDIGSGDPVRGSNTFSLYKKGWRGILIDPLPKNIFLNKLIRRKDKSIQGFVGKTKSEITFYELDPYEYSTAVEPRALELIKNKDAKLVQITLQSSVVISELDLNFDQNNPSLLSIDCEGYDFEILKTIEFKKYKFRIVIIEDFELKVHSSKIYKLLIKNNYQFIERTGPSSIYVLKSYLAKNKFYKD
jgi:FkbM family methyltransferase